MPVNDIQTFRFVAALGFALGAIGGVALWKATPEAIHSSGVAAGTTAACVMMAALSLAIPWERKSPAWLMLPPLVGTIVVMVAIGNMDGGRETYSGFYLYIALAAAFFLRQAQLLVVVSAIVVCSAAPLVYGDEPLVESTVNWVYTCAGAGVVALVLSKARQRMRQYASAAETAALADQLTGVMNRRGFEQFGNAALARAERSGAAVAFLYLDLDGFKLVNDHHGHGTGDRVLRRTAQAMSASLRGGDALARVGGDEFVAVLEGSDRAAEVALRLVRAVEDVAADEAGCEHLSASVGYGISPTDGETLEELMRAADDRLGAAKRTRKRRVQAPGRPALPRPNPRAAA